MRQSSAPFFSFGFDLRIISVEVVNRFYCLVCGQIFRHFRKNCGRVEKRYRHVLEDALVLSRREPWFFAGRREPDVFDDHIHRRLNLSVEDDPGLTKPPYGLSAGTDAVLEGPIVNGLKLARRHHRNDALVFEFVRQNPPLWKSW